MQAKDAIRFVIKKKGLTIEGASLETGRAKSYFSALFSRGSIPKADTLADLLDRLGWDLLIRDRTDDFEITIDPK